MFKAVVNTLSPNHSWNVTVLKRRPEERPFRIIVWFAKDQVYTYSVCLGGVIPFLSELSYSALLWKSLLSQQATTLSKKCLKLPFTKWRARDSKCSYVWLHLLMKDLPFKVYSKDKATFSDCVILIIGESGGKIISPQCFNVWNYILYKKNSLSRSFQVSLNKHVTTF